MAKNDKKDLPMEREGECRVSVRFIELVPEEAEFLAEYKSVMPSRRQEWLRRRLLVGHSLVKRGEDHLLVGATGVDCKPAAETAAPATNNKELARVALGGLFSGGERAK